MARSMHSAWPPIVIRSPVFRVPSALYTGIGTAVLRILSRCLWTKHLLMALLVHPLSSNPFVVRILVPVTGCSMIVLCACRGPPLHTDFTHRLHLNKSHHRTAMASGRLPFTYSIPIFHFRFILLFHILNLEPKSGSKQTSIGLRLGLPTYIYTVELLIDTQFEYQLGLAKSLSDSKSNPSLSKSAASAPLDHPYSLSKPSLSADSVPQSNLRASAQG